MVRRSIIAKWRQPARGSLLRFTGISLSCLVNKQLQVVPSPCVYLIRLKGHGRFSTFLLRTSPQQEIGLVFFGSGISPKSRSAPSPTCWPTVALTCRPANPCTSPPSGSAPPRGNRGPWRNWPEIRLQLPFVLSMRFDNLTSKRAGHMVKARMLKSGLCGCRAPSLLGQGLGGNDVVDGLPDEPLRLVQGIAESKIETVTVQGALPGVASPPQIILAHRGVFPLELP